MLFFSKCFKQKVKQKLRNPEVFVTQMMGAIVLGLVMGSIYYQMKPTGCEIFADFCLF
jgi:hypothetical protein